MSSVVEALRDRLVEPERRRAVRLIKPRAQLKLAAYLLILSGGFGLIQAFNSWSAYGQLAEAALATAPDPLKQDLLDQTQAYLNASLVLLVGYVLAVLAVSIGYLHRLLGPTVALERHLRALRRGDFTARVSLRGEDGHLYSELANQLNDLAAQFEGARSSAQ